MTPNQPGPWFEVSRHATDPSGTIRWDHPRWQSKVSKARDGSYVVYSRERVALGARQAAPVKAAIRRLKRNTGRRSSPARPKSPKFSEMTVWSSVGAVRTAGHPSVMAGMLPPGVAAKFKKLPPGLYKYGWGPKKGEAIVQFKNASLLGAMTSTRIGASKVAETHYVVDNFDPRSPVIIRGIDDRGRTYFRVEEYAKTLVGTPEHVVVSRKRTTSKSAKR